MGISSPPPADRANPLPWGVVLNEQRPATGWQRVANAFPYTLLCAAPGKTSKNGCTGPLRNLITGPKRYVNKFPDTDPFTPPGKFGDPAGMVNWVVLLL